MRKLMFTMLAAGALCLASPLAASAKDCGKGAAAGGLAGHEVGSGHAVAGAAAGCAIGHHEAAKKQDKAAKNNSSEANQGSGSSTPQNGKHQQ